MKFKEWIGEIFVMKNQISWSFILIDTFIVLITVCTFYIFKGNSLNIFGFESISIFILFWLSFISGFYFFKLYRRSWKLISIYEFQLLIKSSILSMGIILLTHILLFSFISLPLSLTELLLIWLFISHGVISYRLLRWMYQESKGNKNINGKETLIVGAGNAGVLVLKELKKSIDSPLYPIAFIDDDPKMQNLHILGIPVVGTRENIGEMIVKYNIKVVIIAIPSALGSEVTQIVNKCKEYGVEIKIFPRVSDIINGRISLNTIRDVRVEDLLGRPPIQLDLLSISNYIKGKDVLISGAGGSIGSEICRQAANFNPQTIILLGHGENSIYLIEKEIKQKYPHLSIETVIADIQDRKRMEHVFSTYHPQVVFHAAAHKHVPLMEYNPTEAIKNNIFGTKNVAECADKYGAEKFVQISTDKAVNPTSIMGVTKRIAELVIQSLNEKSSTKYSIVRFGNVLGSRGSVVPLFKQQIREGGPITVTHPDMTRFFMTIPEAVQLVIQAGTLDSEGEIFVLDMGQPVKISDLAKRLITLSGLTLDKDIQIKYTGMRPGEKLYEELFTNEEGSKASKHELIFISRPANFSKTQLTSLLKQLEVMLYTSEEPIKPDDLKMMLKQIVPTYQAAIHTPNSNE